MLDGLFFDPTSATTTARVRGTRRREGNWIGTYGSQGYDVIGEAASLPSYATDHALGRTRRYTWTANSSDPRSLQDADRHRPHRRLLVRADQLHGRRGPDRRPDCTNWPCTSSTGADKGRSEQVQISNADDGGGAEYPRRSRRSPSGVYLRWTVSGNVAITITTRRRAQRRAQRPVPRPAPATTAAVINRTDARGAGSGPTARRAMTSSATRPACPSYATITPSGAVELTAGREHDSPAGPPRHAAAPAASPPAGTRRPASPWMST